MALDPMLSMLMEPLQVEPPPRPRPRPRPPPVAPAPAHVATRASTHSAAAAAVARSQSAQAQSKGQSKTQSKAAPSPKNRQRTHAQEREGRRSGARDGSMPADGNAAWLNDAVTPRQDGQGDDGDGTREETDSTDEEGSASRNGGRKLAGGCDYDTELVLDLLPAQADSGIFEVLFPNGESMGVMVDIGASSAAFMLAPRGDALRSLLSGKKMELEAGLGRRMDKYVRLTVL